MSSARFANLSLSVVLPAYNEEPLLEANVRRAIASLKTMVGRFEILLIDDCSTDRTAEIADRLAAEHPEVRVIHNPRNLRQGGCVRLGFDLARLDYVTHNAVDYPFDFEDLPQVLRHLPQADVVVVTRRSYPGVSLGRRLASWVNRTLIRLLFHVHLDDYNFVQVYRTAVLREQDCVSEATAFMTVERIVRAHRAGHKVVAVEADYHRREVGQSSSGSFRVIRDSLRDMARVWWQLRRRSARRTHPVAEGDAR